MYLIFAAIVDFHPLAPACAALVCICVSIPRSFFHPLYPVYHILPSVPATLSRHNWYPARRRLASCVTFLSAYVSISHRYSSHFHPAIDTSSRSAYVLPLATRGVLNPYKIQQNFAYYIPEEDTHILFAFKIRITTKR